MLHPNLVVMDAKTELTDKTRWMKMEPPDVIAQIMGLDLTNAASRVAFMASEKEEPVDMLDETLWDKEHESPVQSPPYETVQRTESNLQLHQHDPAKPVMISNIVTLHKALKSGAEVLVGDDVWDAGLEPTQSSADEPPSTSNLSLRDMSQETKLLLAALKREVLLLRNELNFELFVKQQHLQHIGRLHREHVLDSSVEAERQQLVRVELICCN